MKGRARRGVRRPLFSPLAVAAWCGSATLACSEAGSTQAPFSYAGASSVQTTGGHGVTTGGTSVATGGAGTGGAALGAGTSSGGSLVEPRANGGMPAFGSGGSTGGFTFVAGAGGGGGSTGGGAGSAGIGAGGTPPSGGAPASAGSGGAAPAFTFAEVAALLGKSCATMSSCHGTGSAQTTFTGSRLYDTLRSQRGIPYCDDAPLVVPNDPAGSALYKVIGGHCGNFVMPPFSACKTVYCPTEEDWNRIGGWIAKGAPND